ncbi:MAG: ribonuclease P protein component [SAR324 cluster bacterium]|nr:ribonuclease P protein component [SAR324 cluster bacterium]
MHKQNGERYRFSGKHRLKSRKSIDLLFKKGRYQSCRFLKFRYLPQTLGYARVVITISKRVGTSPFRNQLKRLIREALRLSGHLQRRSIDCAVFITNPMEKKPSLTEIREIIEYLFTHLPDEST